MKKNWKFDSNHFFLVKIKKCLTIVGIVVIIYTLACNKRDQHKHISIDSTIKLDSLEKSSDQILIKESLTITPEEKSIVPTFTATGVITYDPRLFNIISARFSGRIEKLYVRYNYQRIAKGQRIMDIYSPEILTAQQNLLFLLENEIINSTLLPVAKQKLKLLGLTDKQLEQIATTGQVINPLPVFSPYDGHIHDIGLGNKMASSAFENAEMGSGMKKSFITKSKTEVETLPASTTSALSIREGMYIQGGQNIFAVYKIDRVWAVLNIFPQDAIFIHVGDKVSFSAETDPHNLISSVISYIEPVANDNTYTIKARVYLRNSNNPGLKIGTFISAEIISKKINGIWLPRTAVINLGKKQIVFLKTEETYVTKIVQTGYVTDQLIQIISGLNGNDLIAANAQSMVDSESFIKSEDSENE